MHNTIICCCLLIINLTCVAMSLLKFMVSIRSERHRTSLQLLIEESNTQYTYAQFKVSLLTAVFKSYR